MGTTYNRIAGRNAERLAALSDGVFAIAMTLLVLGLRLTGDMASIRTEGDLWLKLVELAPRLIAFVLSFLTLGIFGWGSKPSSTSSPAAIGPSPGSTSGSCARSR